MELSSRDIISEYARERVVEKLISNMKMSTGEDADDLKDLSQDIYLQLMEKEDSLIEGLYKRGELKYYISRMIVNNIHSKSSPYYSTYKKGRGEYDKFQQDI